MNSAFIPPAGQSGRIAFVHAAWHADIVGRGKEGFLEEASRLGVDPGRVDCIEVPGAFELPLRCKQLGRESRYALIVAAGFVVDGGIYRHEFVAQAVISGLMDVQLALDLPVLSLVLTPKDFHENPAQQEFFLAHFREKGREAARTALALLPELAGGSSALV